MHYNRSYTLSRGFTIIELVMVMVIIAILSAVALPSYTDYITRANRNIAKTALLDAASRLESWKLDNKTYVITDATDLGYPAAAVYFDADGQNSTAGEAVYRLTATGLGVNTYTINAVPQNRQATKDTDCATMSMNEIGVKTETGTLTADECW